ncbi:glycosyltransferase [bacterium]|nr:glycosyltransferase [Mariniblastus sp.]MDB4380367.1 glycosyltransferase [Mariniblastus sp.]MDB4460823.1 glycosyltransferase [bacterium]MDB4564320.1 glycosyltransferase [Mariniblastus sp.]
MAPFREDNTILKIAQFNTFPYGGAATAAKRLHEQLIQRNVESNFYYRLNDKLLQLDDSFHCVEFRPPRPRSGFFGAIDKRLTRRREKTIHRLYDGHIAGRQNGLETFSMADLPESTWLDWPAIDADVVHLHWMSFFADYDSFFKSIPDSVPLVWTLHDMNAFTGGCHYSGGCERFSTGCGSCPQVENRQAGDVSDYSFRTKRRALAGKSIHVITPSQWLGDLAKQSDIWPVGTTFDTLHYGLDLDLFQSVSKQQARRELGVTGEKTLIAFGAEDITCQRKGVQHLLPALMHLEDKLNVECLMFGSGTLEVSDDLPLIHQLGYVDSLERQSLIYSAADIVVVPSLEDNQPQVGLEALACGTPVVGFNAGGIPEYVRPGETGLLAEVGDSADLSKQIGWLVAHVEEREEMGARGREMMEQEFEKNAQSQKQVDFYKQILADGPVSIAS